MLQFSTFEDITLETRELSYFAKVVEEGSIRKAAESIGISQPALTKCIRLFEQRLNVKLLVRGSAGVVPTDHGKSLYARAKAVIAEVARAKMELEELSGRGGGALTVGTLPSQASDLLPRAAVRFTKANPGTSLFVVERSFEELFTGLRQGEFDFVISSLGRYEDDRSFAHKILFRDKPTIIVRSGHPLTEMRSVKSKDLVNCSWVLPPPGTMHRKLVERMFEVNDAPMPRGMIECHSASFLKTVVMHSDYVGILPSNVLTHEEASGAIVSLNILPELPNRSIAVFYRANYPLSGAASALIRELRRLVKERAI